MRLLRDELAFDYLVFVTAWIVLPSVCWRWCTACSRTSRASPWSPGRGCPVTARGLHTVSDLFRTAEWHERETAELFGIVFEGHPDPRRLLLPDDLEGYPLRKDFTHPNLIRLPEVH